MEEEAKDKGIKFDYNNTKFQIVDVNVAKTDLKDIGILLKMNKIRKEIMQIERRQNNDTKPEKYERKLLAMNGQFSELKKEYYAITAHLGQQ